MDYGVIEKKLLRIYCETKFVLYILIGTTIKASPELNIWKNIRVRPMNWLWNNVRSPITYLPNFLKDEILFRLPINDIKEGTKFKITTRWPSDIYIARQKGENCGLAEDSLRNDDWELKDEDAFVRVKTYDYRKFCGCIRIRSEFISEIHLELWHKKVDGNKVTELPAIAADQEEIEIKPAIALFVVEGKILLKY